MVAIGALLAIILGGYLQRRLDGVAKGSRAFAAGDLSGRADVGPRFDEFDQLAASLNAMLDRITALLRNLHQVTADLAHDMRTPLSHLRSHLELMRDAPDGLRSEMIELAIEKSDDLLGLFAAILRISELEQADLNRYFRVLDLGALVQEIYETHEPLAEDSGHTLSLTQTMSNIPVKADRELLSQALINLLQNAFRHTPLGSRIELGAEMEAGPTGPVRARRWPRYLRDRPLAGGGWLRQARKRALNARSWSGPEPRQSNSGGSWCAT